MQEEKPISYQLLLAERDEFRLRVAQLEMELAQVKEGLLPQRVAGRRLDEALWRLVFQHAHDAVLIMDDSLRYVDVNDAACVLTGYGRDELLGMQIGELIPEQHALQLSEKWTAFLENGRLMGESQVRRKDGAVIAVEYRSAANILPGMHMAILRDIQQLKLVEAEKAIYQQRLEQLVKRRTEELNRQRSNVQQFLDLANVIFVVLDEDGLITLINRKGCALLGYEEAELVGCNWFDTCLPARKREEVRAIFSREIQKNEGQMLAYYDNLVLTRSGEERLIAWQNAFLQLDDGARGIVSAGEDVTDRRQAEAALRESEMLYRTLVEASPTAIFLVRDGRYVFCNQHAVTYLDVDSVEDIIGQPVLKFIHPEHQKTVEKRIKMLSEGQENEPLPLMVQRRDGRILWSESRSIPVEIDGEPVFMIIGVDITDRIEDAARLEEAYAQLQTLTHLKDEFVTTISHELRTPLANLRLYHHLLGVRPERGPLYLQTLQRETSRLEYIVEMMLYVTRLHQEEEMPRKRPFNLHEMAQKFVTDRQILAESRGLALQYRHDESNPEVLGDSKMLERVLGQLLDNAFNFTPTGGWVGVSVGMHEADGQQWARLQVMDNGRGVSLQDADKIFRRFYRGKNAQELGIPGTGLGLYIAQEIVSQHNGRIWLDAAPQSGLQTVFSIVLPLV